MGTERRFQRFEAAHERARLDPIADEAVPGRTSLVADELAAEERRRPARKVPGRRTRVAWRPERRLGCPGRQTLVELQREHVAPVVHVARRAEAANHEVAVSPSVLHALLRTPPGGARLPAELERRLASALGVDLAAARIHTDEHAAGLAAQLGARALTVGADIYFARGAYDPSSAAGVELIAHEAMHVAQRAHGTLPTTGPMVSRPDDAHEHQADAFARQFIVEPAAIPARAPIAAPSRGAVERVDLSPEPDRIAAHSADAMWQQMFHAGSRSVGKLARVAAPRGIVLKATPSPDADKVSPILALNGLIYVERTTLQPDVAQRWCYVTSIDGGGAGFIEERYLAIDPPEPQATVHPVAAGETLGGIANRAYQRDITGGNDARLYVQAIYEANRGRSGIQLADVNLGWLQSLAREQAEEETLKIYLGVKVVAGHVIWIPSDAFVQLLKASGQITSGTTDLSKAWRVTEQLVHAIAAEGMFAAGYTVGALEGAWQAIVDIFKGAWDLMKLAFEVVKANLNDTIGARIREVADKLRAFFSQLDPAALAKSFGAYIADKWSSGSWFGRGRFLGEVVGYIALNVLLAMASAGGSVGVVLARAATGGSVLARTVLVFVEATEVAQNPLKLIETAAKGARIAESAAGQLKRGLAREVEHGAAEAETAKRAVHAPAEPHAPTAEPHAPTAGASRLAALEKLLPPDLKGRLVENRALQGKTVRVTYRQGVRIEVSANATARELEWHIATARALMRYEGPLGKIRQLLNAIAAKLGLADKYGTRGFEAAAELRKLNSIKASLEATQRKIEMTFARYGSAREIAVNEAEQLQHELAGIDLQIREHEAALHSAEAGRGYVAAEDATQYLKGVAGTEAKLALKKYAISAGDEAAALERVREKANAAAQRAYEDAIAAGMNAETAKGKMTPTARTVARTEATKEALAAAQRESGSTVRAGKALAPQGLDHQGQMKLAGYLKGDAFEARRLSSTLQGASEKEFLEVMSNEVASGKVPVPKSSNIPGPPPQKMLTWEYSDGSVVRYKPQGDRRRAVTYSLEIKKDPSLPDKDLKGIAFKLDSQGRPSPKDPESVANIYSSSTHKEQHDAFRDAILNDSHLELK